MKIGKSVVNFSITASSSCKCKSIDEVPYWSLYSRPGDCLQDELGHQWRSDRPLTLAELKQYLEHYPGRRLLDAYPRQSTNQRISYKTLTQGNIVHVYGRWDGEIYATFVVENNELRNTYIADDVRNNLHYYNILARKQAFAKGLINEDVFQNSYKQLTSKLSTL